MAISKESQEIIDTTAEIAAAAAASLNIAFHEKGFTSKEAFKLTQIFLTGTVNDVAG